MGPGSSPIRSSPLLRAILGHLIDACKATAKRQRPSENDILPAAENNRLHRRWRPHLD